MSAKGDRLRGRLSINPDEPVPPPVPAVVPVPDPPAETSTPAPTADPEPQPEQDGELARVVEAPRPRPRRAKAKPAPPPLATEDPSIRPGVKDYRSFYIEDTIFARFRAAVYWLSRHPEASVEVPENMSVAVEDWMRETAGDLERRYNDGQVFRMPPGARRRRGGDQ